MVDLVELYGSIKCEVCGVPWEEHDSSCSGHFRAIGRLISQVEILREASPSQLRMLEVNGFYARPYQKLPCTTLDGPTS